MRLEGWITTMEAANLTGYTIVYIRRLAELDGWRLSKPAATG
jgi:hypothetical protein